MERAADFTRELASGIADLNARRAERAESAVHFILGLAGVLGALMLAVHWLAG